MANKYWNEIDNEKLKFEEHICAFLDILGYKNKSKDFFDGKLNLYGKINRALQQAGVEKNRDESPDGVYTQIFSDSIIIHSNTKNFDLLLNYVSQLVAYFSYEELYIRGGISIGAYIDKYEANSNFSFFSSEALIKAYEMEQNATFPLIEIDEKLVSKIENSNIVVKFDNKHILNFARYVINEFGKNEDNVIAELEDIEIILQELNKRKESKTTEKIEWIMNYYLWFVEESNVKYKRFEMKKFEKFNKYKNTKLIFTQ